MGLLWAKIVLYSLPIIRPLILTTAQICTVISFFTDEKPES